MKTPLWVSKTARDFWKGVRCLEPFPRKLRESILRSPFDLTVKELDRLTVRGATDYLARLNIVWRDSGPDRPLRACLAAANGAGFILLDAADAVEDRIFSLAHELAHFLRHYWQPRQRACQRLGVRLADVFDGKRRPTPEERLHGLLANIPLSLHIHLMLRGPRQTCSEEVALVEEEADHLAYELLAPAAAGGVAERTERPALCPS